MKAVVYTRYGSPDVLRFTEVEKPTPKDNEVLVKVQAVSLNRSDWEALRGKPLYARIMGPLRPRHHILGSDIAGRVVATGRTTTRFQPGDDVFADILSYMGGFAEYVCVPESALAPMPAGMRYEEAAALPQAGTIALQGIWDDGQVQPGQKVLINGAGGGSGMLKDLARFLPACVTLARRLRADPRGALAGQGRGHSRWAVGAVTDRPAAGVPAHRRPLGRRGCGHPGPALCGPVGGPRGAAGGLAG